MKDIILKYYNSNDKIQLNFDEKNQKSLKINDIFKILIGIDKYEE